MPVAYLFPISVNLISTVVKDVNAVQVAKLSGEETRIHEIGTRIILLELYQIISIKNL